MGKRAPQSPSPRVRSKRVQSVDIMSPLNLDTLEDPGNEKSRSKSRFAGSLLDARAAPILPMVSCAGEKMAVVFGRFWKDPIRRKRKRRQCLYLSCYFDNSSVLPGRTYNVYGNYASQQGVFGNVSVSFPWGISVSGASDYEMCKTQMQCRLE